MLPIGLFLIGQVTMFKPLMKNAINLGAATVKYIVSSGVTPGFGAQTGLDHELVVIGAGPGGTSAGIEAQNADAPNLDQAGDLRRRCGPDAAVAAGQVGAVVGN